MKRIFSKIFLTILFIAAASGAVCAQTDASGQKKNKKKEITKGIQESLAKQRIEREKKDFAELLARSEEALKISGDLEKSYALNNSFSGDDQKKLERLEKVVKKIRNEIGGDTDDAAEDKPLSMLDALKSLQNTTSNLVEELKKTTRYSISVIAVESTSTLLSLVRFLRLRKN